MAEVGRNGRTVVFVSHNLDAITRLCPTSIWLAEGGVKARGPTAGVIEAYLSSDARLIGQREFDDSPEKVVSLRSVAILDKAGRPKSFLTRDEAFTVEVRFTIRAAVGGLDVTAYVQNLQGLRLLDEAWSEHAGEYTVAPGEYCARLTVPPVLNVGDYTVGIWLGTMYEDFAWADDALAFHRGLIEAVESPRLARAFDALEAEWALCFAQVKQARGGLPPRRNVEHREIFDAIVDRDAEEATRLMREHLEDGARLSLGIAD